MTSTTVPDLTASCSGRATAGCATAPTAGAPTTAGGLRGTGRRLEQRAAEVADVVGQATRALCSPTGVVGAAVEAAWVSTHLALYPFGLLGPRRAGDGSRLRRRRAAARCSAGWSSATWRRPGRRSCWSTAWSTTGRSSRCCAAACAAAASAGCSTINYSPADRRRPRPPPRCSPQEVEELVAETGYERMHVVGHSLGGLIARYYVSGSAATSGCTPWSPSARRTAAPTAPTPCRPGCAASCGRAATLMRELAQPAPAAAPGSWPTGPTWTR